MVDPSGTHSGGRGVWAVLDRPTSLAHPDGFSERWTHLLRAVARRWPLDLWALTQNGHSWTGADCRTGVPAARNVWHEDLPTRPLNAPGLAGTARRVRQYLWGQLPYASYPAELPGAGGRLASSPPALAIFFRPQLAHLALTLPASVPRIFMLEEAWDRGLPGGGLLPPLVGSTAGADGLKRRLVVNGEVRRWLRLYARLAKDGSPFFVISDEERDWYARYLPYQQLHVLPHGIDCEHYSPVAVKPRFEVGVFGILEHRRNYDGALGVFQRLKEEGLAGRSVPSTWAFVGSRPHPSIEALASPSVTVTGYVDDMRPYYSATAVVVVPSFEGAGVKTTVLQAWAMGRPVVATSLSTRGVPAVHGENVLVADTVEGLAEHVCSLLANPSLASRLAEAGLRTVRRYRNVTAIAELFSDSCAEVMTDTRLSGTPLGGGRSARGEYPVKR